MSEDLLRHMSDTACVRAWKEEGWGPYHKRLLTMSISLEQQGWKGRNGMTQHHIILNHLRKNGSMTQREAMVDYSIQSFPKRISELRGMGYDITHQRKFHPTTGQMYYRYFLSEKKAKAA
jgi:hypothetical protein